MRKNLISVRFDYFSVPMFRDENGEFVACHRFSGPALRAPN
jgi:hypothetical protein